jgi:hypothetical protein
MINIEDRLSYCMVQHSTYSGSLHRRKGATSHIFDMVWLCHSPIPVGRKVVYYMFICIKKCNFNKRGQIFFSAAEFYGHSARRSCGQPEIFQ